MKRDWLGIIGFALSFITLAGTVLVALSLATGANIVTVALTVLTVCAVIGGLIVIGILAADHHRYK